MSNPSRVQVSGPLAVFVPGFREDFIRRGYTPGAAAKELQLMAHVSRWLATNGLRPGDSTEVGAQRFVEERRVGSFPIGVGEGALPVAWFPARLRSADARALHAADAERSADRALRGLPAAAAGPVSNHRAAPPGHGWINAARATRFTFA